MDNHAEFLKIEDAARILRVTRRTIYRRIWKGELPASKVGGLYFIRRSDLEALINSTRVRGVSAQDKIPGETEPMKCGNCLRLITSDAQIGGICQEEGCGKLVCITCYGQGIRYCVTHLRSQDDEWEKAQAIYKSGGLPILVKGSTARLRELNFINRIQQRISHITTLIHPQNGQVINISNWEPFMQSSDQRMDVMRLLGKVILDTDAVSKIPLNAFLNYQVPTQNNSSFVIFVQCVSHLNEMVQQGFDYRPFTAEDLSAWLMRFSEEAQHTHEFKIIVLAATSGWDSSARLLVQSEKPGAVFVSPFMWVYLFDLETGELIFDQRDERLRNYAELFSPLTEDEELEAITQSIEKEMTIYDSLTLQYACQILPFPRDSIIRAFERIAATGYYMLMHLPDLGMAIVKK